MARTAPLDESRPIPPRFWWLRRILLFVLALSVVWIGSYLWWGREARRRLEVAISELRSHGRPWPASAFAAPPIPDEQNAAYYYAAAFRAIVTSGDGFDWQPLLGRRALSVADIAVAHACVSANRDALEQLCKGAACPHANWEFDFSAAAPAPRFGRLYDQIEIGRLAYLAFHAELDAGGPGAAFGLLECLLAHAGHTRECPTLLGYLMGQLVTELVIDAIDHAGLNPGICAPDDALACGGTCMPRTQVTRLIEALLDEEPMWARRARTMHLEQSWLLSHLATVINVDIFAAGNAVPLPAGGASVARSGAAKWLLQPILESDAARVISLLDANVRMWEARDLPFSSRSSPPQLLGESPVYWSTHFLSGVMLPSYGGAAERDFMIIARRRMAAARLALGLYEFDHGMLPATLAELVPKYLPDVPGDPLLGGTSTIGLSFETDEPCLHAGDPATVSDKDRATGQRYPVALRLEPRAGVTESPTSDQSPSE